MTDSQESTASSKIGGGWLLLQGPFVCLFAGSLAGKLGERLYQMALVMAIIVAFEDTSDKIPLITLAGVIPQFFLYPLIGRLIDAVDRRKLLWVTCALSAALVWLLGPILFLDPRLAEFKAVWAYALGAVFLLSVVLVPFGPARGSAIPDVVDEERTGIAASVIATSGLVSILLGTALGGYLAYRLGSFWVLPVSCGLYAAGALAMRMLPDAVAVPGARRGREASPQDTVVPRTGGWRAYLRENWNGLVYCVRTRGIIALILFEAVFWLCTVSFYSLCDWHASHELNLDVTGRQFYFSVGLGCAGIGLFAGALAIGKFCRQITPILTYAPAHLFLGLAMAMVFSTQGEANPGRGVLAFSERYAREEALAELPRERQAETRALAAEIAQAPEKHLDLRRAKDLDARNAVRVHGLLFWLFLMGLGGGLLLGRIDADILALSEEKMRGRVFSLKGFAFTGALLIPLFVFWLNTSYDTRVYIAYYAPMVLMWGAIPVVVLSWTLDCGLYGDRKEIHVASPVDRAIFRVARFLSWLICRIYFRYRVEGAERIPREGPVLMCANHGSFLDPIWLGIATPRSVRYIMHASYFRSWAHPIFRVLNCIPVEEGGTLAALKAGTRELEKGSVLGMFPEGHVSEDGRLQRPKSGALFLAQRSGAIVVPVALKGNLAAFPRKARFPKPLQITARVGTPFQVPKGASREELEAISERLMVEIAGLLDVPPPPTETRGN